MNFNPQIGASLTLHSNLGKSVGIIDDISELHDTVSYTGWLTNDEGRFEIIKTATQLAGSIHWSSRIIRINSFTSSYITKVEL